MNTIRKTLIVSLAALGLSAASLGAQAQTEGRYTHAANAQEWQAKRAEHFAARQAKLHDALKLSGAQEAAWTTYQAAIAPQAPSAHPDRAAFKAMSAPERMQAMIDFAKQRTARMEQHLAALTAFYGQLTPEQKQVFDQFTSHHERHGHHGDGMREG